MSTQTVSVKILDKEFQVACPTDQQQSLLQAAQHLDKQMRDIRTTGKVIGLERIAVMAALNISHELLQTKQQGTSSEAETEAVKRISDRVDSTLHRCRQLEIS